MTQTQLNRAVAHATGESVRRISKMGFDVADPLLVQFDPEPYDRQTGIVDWDELDAERNVSLLPQRSRRNVLV